MEKPDVYIEVQSTNEEFERALKKRKTPCEVFIQMRDIVVLLDAEMIKQLRVIMDIGSLYIQQRVSSFQEYMKIKGFWPDFVLDDSKSGISSSILKQKDENGDGNTTNNNPQQQQ